MEKKQASAVAAATKESQMKFALSRLTDEDMKLRAPILEAASAAARLALDPDSQELRKKAAEAWAQIDAIIIKHLSVENGKMLPWAESLADFPHGLADRARKKHEQVKALRDMIATHSFEKGTDEEIAATARNLCVLATTLDDLIAGEQRELFPVIRRILFGAAKL
jgi:hypothetical protein